VFESVKKAGITPQLIATCIKVTRPTAYSWLAGGTPSIHLLPKVRTFIKLVDRALAAGELPFPPGVAKKDRLTYLKDVLQRHAGG
jgi:hypothetical protein